MRNYCKNCYELTEKLEVKEQEYDKLKAEKTEALEQIEFVRTLNTVKEAEIRKLSKTLTEIKEICKINVCKHCHSKLKVDDNYCKNIKDCDCYKILQKISEVEND